MEIVNNNYILFIEKTCQETQEHFHLRCQAIAKCLDNRPSEIEKMPEIIQMSHYWIAHKFMKCSYKKNIENKMYYYFDSLKK